MRADQKDIYILLCHIVIEKKYCYHCINFNPFRGLKWSNKEFIFLFDVHKNFVGETENMHTKYTYI